MAHKQPSSLVDRLITRLKNNPVVAVLIVTGLLVISLASFTDALTKILSTISDLYHPAVAGQWQSEALTDVQTHERYTYSFQIKVDGHRLYGTALRTAPFCEENKEARFGVCGAYGRPVAILNGKRERDIVSFVCDWGEVPQSPFHRVTLRETFRGVLKGNKIRFVQQDNQNSPPVEFTATQVAAPGSGRDQ